MIVRVYENISNIEEAQPSHWNVYWLSRCLTSDKQMSNRPCVIFSSFAVRTIGSLYFVNRHFDGDKRVNSPMGRRVVIGRWSRRIPEAVATIVGPLVHRWKLRVECDECRRKLQRTVSAAGCRASSVGRGRCSRQSVGRGQSCVVMSCRSGQRMTRMVERVHLHVLVKSLFLRHRSDVNKRVTLRKINSVDLDLQTPSLTHYQILLLLFTYPFSFRWFFESFPWRRQCSVVVPAERCLQNSRGKVHAISRIR